MATRMERCGERRRCEGNDDGVSSSRRRGTSNDGDGCGDGDNAGNAATAKQQQPTRAESSGAERQYNDGEDDRDDGARQLR